MPNDTRRQLLKLGTAGTIALTSTTTPAKAFQLHNAQAKAIACVKFCFLEGQELQIGLELANRQPPFQVSPLRVGIESANPLVILHDIREAVIDYVKAQGGGDLKPRDIVVFGGPSLI